ncbi:MAG TPA: hypothetical protein PKM11_03350 [Methanomassiliicoccales archaeon]|nr:hypothetical protein [Methanomassiliicoccales archaeon]
MAKFENVYRIIGPELDELARLNKGQIPRAVFERLIAENFGCNDRTISSYTRTFKTFGIIRPLNKTWYQFKPWTHGGEDEEDETLSHQLAKVAPMDREP